MDLYDNDAKKRLIEATRKLDRTYRIKNRPPLPQDDDLRAQLSRTIAAYHDAHDNFERERARALELIEELAETRSVLEETQQALNTAINERNEAQQKYILVDYRRQDLHEQLAILDDEYHNLKDRFVENLDIIATLKRQLTPLPTPPAALRADEV